MKPYKWRFGAEQTPIPGRARRGPKPPKPPKVAEFTPAVVEAKPVEPVQDGWQPYRLFSSYVNFSELQDPNSWGEPPTPLPLSYLSRMFFASFGPPRALAPPDYEFEAYEAELAHRGPTFELDVGGRCMICGKIGCEWWAAFCAWRAGKGERPNWRDGSIDVELAKEHLLGAGKEEA